MKLGQLEKVDLRDYWKNEASDFTPWLSNEENIKVLGEAIGMELEVVGQEEAVGSFRADILCKDTLTEKYVLIENQLEETDHKHLGQIVTYAAGLDAETIIWIAGKFNEQHRAAIDWLNSKSEENINFFGIEIALYKIGESPAAPMFDIVAKPNDWSKTVKGDVKRADLSDHRLFLQEYWQALKSYVESTKATFKMQKPLPQHWTNIAVGRSYFHISASVVKRDNFIRIELIVDGAKSKENFKILLDKYEVDSRDKIDKNIIWDELPDARVCSIYIKKEVDVTNKKDWNNQHEWFKENIEKFHNFFSPKIKNLD